MVVDASAIVAMFAEEDGYALTRRLYAAPRRVTHPISVYESAIAIGRLKNVELGVARDRVSQFLALAGIELLPLGEAETIAALDTHARYGRGRGHPARLNMGDCFSYACARLRGLPLLYEGDDFAKTDLAADLA